MIEIALDRHVIETGSFLTGRVVWAGDARVSRIIIAAQWETRGTGNAVWGVGRSTVFRPAAGVRETTVPFRLLIPYGGPISFGSVLIEMVWTLRVRIDQRGFDELAQMEFRVEPRKV